MILDPCYHGYFEVSFAHVCDNVNKEDAIASVNLIDACETLCKKLSKSLKIAKKFEEELKLANLEKEELVVRLDESNKKNGFWDIRFPFKMRSWKAWNKS